MVSVSKSIQCSATTTYDLDSISSTHSVAHNVDFGVQCSLEGGTLGLRVN